MSFKNFKRYNGRNVQHCSNDMKRDAHAQNNIIEMELSGYDIPDRFLDKLKKKDHNTIYHWYWQFHKKRRQKPERSWKSYKKKRQWE